MPFGAYGNSSCGLGYIADPYSCGNVRCRRFSVLNSKCQDATDEQFKALVQYGINLTITEQLKDGKECKL